MPGKNLPMTGPAMVEAELSRKGNRMYRAESSEFVDGQLTALVDDMAEQLEQVADMTPVSLSDTSRVKSISLAYIRACAAASTLPNVTGSSRSLGLSRAAVYDCINRQSPREAADWLTLCREGFAELLENSSLRNSTNPVVSIFLLKAVHNYRESAELIVSSKDTGPLGEQMTAEQIAQKYQDMVED